MRQVFTITTLVFVLSFSLSIAQPNCNIYKEDKSCYNACLEAEKAEQNPQGSKESQEHFLTSIELCPDFDYSYFESSVPFAKRGLMNQWITIFNHAVDINPVAHLGWRGWYHFFFMHNYEKAIADIDLLDNLKSYDIGDTGNGLYHLNIMKALCYKGLNQYQTALDIFKKQVNSPDYYVGSYDNLHLGVIYLRLNEPENALEKFGEQMDFNDISEAHYYSAEAYEIMGDEKKAMEHLEIALSKYESRIAMNDPYVQLPDQIYKSDIEKKLKKCD